MIDLNKIKSRISKLSEKNNVPHQSSYDTFLFERFLFLLANSKYKNNFVFKGGFLLENIVGIENRSTMDMDLKIQNEVLSKENIFKIFKELECGYGNFSYTIISVKDIKATMKYPGVSIKILGKYGNLKKTFSVDIATGDIVTPAPILYRYISSIDDLSFDILAYNKETILSEKFQTLISKGESNSRSKDFYDMYLLEKEGYDVELFNKAIKNTFSNRETKFEKDLILKTINQIKESNIQKERFNRYSRNNEFVKNVSFEDVMDAIIKIYDSIIF